MASFSGGWLRVGALVLLVGCGQARLKKAQEDAQAIATAEAKEWAVRGGDLCPDVDHRAIDRLRVNGEIAEGVQSEDPWGMAYAIACGGRVVTITSAGPDKKAGTADDIHATAVRPAAPAAIATATFARTPDPVPSPASTRPTSTTGASPACLKCDQLRMACLIIVKGGQLAEGSEAFADPVQASKSECAFKYIECTAEIREKTGSKCPPPGSR